MEQKENKHLLLNANGAIIRMLELEKELVAATSSKECLEIVGQMRKLEIYLNEHFNVEEQGT